MPKKPKIDKRLDQLFKDLQPEEAPSKRRQSKVPSEALASAPDQAHSTDSSPESHSKTGTIFPDAVSANAAAGRIALTFQAGQQEWATLQVVDETSPRSWSEDEQLLVKQVTDQLSLALENARLFQETQSALETTRYRADVENLINDIATEFLNINDPQMIDQLINRNLGRLGSYVQVDRCYIFLFNPENNTMSNTHEWCAPGVMPFISELQNLPLDTYPYLMRHIDKGQALFASKVANLPEEAALERADFQNQGIQSIICVPVTQQNRAVGFLGFDSVKAQRNWNEDDVITLRLFGQVVISALDRARKQEALTKSEADLRALFSAMEDVVFVVDRDARYIRIGPTNPSRLIRPPEELLGRLMEDFIEKETTDRFKTAIAETLDSGETHQIEYELPIGDEKYWFLASLSKLNEENVFWVARDITARKKAEENLTRFKLGIENSGDAVFMTDVHGEIIYANPAFEKVYGHKPEDAIGHTPRIIKSGLVPPEGYKQFWATLLSKQTVSGELINKAKDGRLISIAGTNSPILDEKGNILGFLAVHHDISAMKHAEEALRTSEAQLTDALKTSHLAYWAFDPERGMFTFNDQIYAMLHTTAEAQGGYEMPAEAYVQRFIYPEDIPYVGSKIAESMASTDQHYETEAEARMLCADGEMRWFLTRVQILRDEAGRILQYSGTNQDITERKQAEQAIQRQNEYLAASAEIGRLITSTLDVNTIFTRTVNLINERFGFYHAGIFIVEETGFNAVLREATGQAGSEMLRQKHRLAVNSQSIVGKVTGEGVPLVVNNTDTDPIHKKNPLLPDTKAEAAIPLRVGNRIIGALDIQSTKVDAFTQDEIGVLQTLADQIAVAIDNARSFELSQQAVMEMREIDRLKSQFLANMSHELRTPLNSIIGFSRVILKGIDGPVTELQQQDLTAIYNSGQHLLGLINDILDLSKIEAGKMELAFDEVNMSDITNSVLSTMTGLIKDKSITLRRNIQPDLPTVRADAIRVRQVMINLLSNAAKFTDEGEITVDVGVKEGPSGRPEMMVSVTDTGPGIALQDQAKLFQPFSQVDDSPTRKTGGTGLGLSICQHLIHMHGGNIGVHSELGHGSTFYFTLPLFRNEKDSNGTSSGKVVLAIDDDPQVIGLYERYLQPQGYQVISLTDPSRAVERVRQLKPFAVTLDIMMPGVDGWQVLSRLKSDPETRDVPVIICSIIEDHEKGFSLGAADYLVKPILEEDLVNALDRLNADGSIHEVLVIDDDPNDLRLIGKMLNDDGRYKAILAQGGPRGWEIISSNSPPQAVILDLFMPEMDGFRILENMRSDAKLCDIPVIVISGMDLTAEQHKQLEAFGQRLLTKGSFKEKELFALINRSLKRVPDN